MTPIPADQPRQERRGHATCVVADDHPAILRAVVEVLSEHGMAVVGHARDGIEALEIVAEQRPDVAVVDADMPRMSGLDVARAVVAAGGPTRVLLYGDARDRAFVAEGRDAGVRGFVLKEAPLDDLVRAVKLVADGSAYVDPVLASQVFAYGGAPHLTPREREVLRLLADGNSNVSVARQLGISPDTVRTHLRKAMDKLAASTRTEAVATALRQSLIS